jgi:hypothetical protein
MKTKTIQIKKTSMCSTNNNRFDNNHDLYFFFPQLLLLFYIVVVCYRVDTSFSSPFLFIRFYFSFDCHSISQDWYHETSIKENLYLVIAIRTLIH